MYNKATISPGGSLAKTKFLHEGFVVQVLVDYANATVTVKKYGFSKTYPLIAYEVFDGAMQSFAKAALKGEIPEYKVQEKST